MGFGTTVEEGSIRGGDSFFAFESGIESFFDESFANIGDGIGVTVKLFSNIFIGDSSVDGFVNGEEDIGVFDFGGVGFALGDEWG
jgi:hypothetical protein